MIYLHTFSELREIKRDVQFSIIILLIQFEHVETIQLVYTQSISD